MALVGRNHRWLRRAGLLAAGACAAFFRHPTRVPPTRPGAVVAPADGEICVIDSAAPPAELGMADAPLPRVSIFLSLLDAHVQRAPVSGEVIAVQHRPGRFGSADLAAASAENERTSLRIRTDTGAEVSEVIVVQIAGLLARRIVCNAHVGDKLSIGDTYGLIRFGSRLDTYLPPGTEPLVKVGQRAVAGETLLAELP
jgi:phosphatidylserine decarboxylase